jgi:hypothetical protein
MRLQGTKSFAIGGHYNNLPNISHSKHDTRYTQYSVMKRHLFQTTYQNFNIASVIRFFVIHDLSDPPPKSQCYDFPCAGQHDLMVIDIHAPMC